MPGLSVLMFLQNQYHILMSGLHHVSQIPFLICFIRPPLLKCSVCPFVLFVFSLWDFFCVPESQYMYEFYFQVLYSIVNILSCADLISSLSLLLTLTMLYRSISILVIHSTVQRFRHPIDFSTDFVTNTYLIYSALLNQYRNIDLDCEALHFQENDLHLDNVCIKKAIYYVRDKN